MLKQIAHFLRQTHILPLFFVIVFLTSGLIINALQAIMYLTLRNVSKYWYRKLNYYTTYALHSQVVFLGEWWCGSDTLMYADPETVKEFFGKEHAYLIMNHCYEVDWMMGYLIVDRMKVLGNAKVYVKSMVKKVPLFGWNWYFGESVFLERNWEKDKLTFGSQISRLMEYPDPIWFLLYAEGTRFTPEKHAVSMEVAREKGLPELKHHLLPRTRGFTASLPFLRGKIPAVYDVIMGIEKSQQPTATLKSMLLGHRCETHLWFRRIPVENIPTDESEAALWLHKLYQEKDRILDHFLEHGAFPNDGDYSSYRTIKVPRRINSALNVGFWMLVTGSPILYLLFGMLLSGSLVQIVCAVSLIALGLFAMRKLIGLTKISKGSAYGKDGNGSPKKEK